MKPNYLSRKKIWEKTLKTLFKACDYFEEKI